ncbi:DUF6907 domain-containing protein [Streptomyces turgidiscabies]|uniref:DUF6907 domain-containing protein n=1 Tax=Streptomyces turgidiscabies TaxID=85558 RepID=UPI0038F5EEC6
MNELPTFGPTEVFREEDVTPDAVVRVAFALSREQLLTALSIGFTEMGPDRDAAGLTVDETRTEVEGWLHAAAVLELDRYVRQGQLTAYPLEAQPVMDALAAALDRAYPADTRGDSPSALTVADLPPVQQPRTADGTVQLLTLDHGCVAVDEPAWCIGHAGEPVGYRADITHRGRVVAAEVETGWAAFELLPARISWAPFGVLQPEPYPVADIEDLPPLDPQQLREVAAEVALHAGHLYRLANELDRIRRGQS